MVNGRVVESDPPNKLVTTFNAHWDPRISEVPESTVTFEIAQLGEACKLTLIHSDLLPGHMLTEGVISRLAGNTFRTEDAFGNRFAADYYPTCD
jgi:uncharacterized protein YndB with AHSA1/START domain